MATTSLRTLANTRASYLHWYGPDDERTKDVCREVTVRKLADAIAVALAANPPITDSQRMALARMIIGADIEVAA